MKNIVPFILFLFSACHSNNQEDYPLKVITSFPINQELKMQRIKLPVHILVSRAMFVSEEYLFVYKEKDSTFFDVFTLPDCEYFCSVGTKGGGPDDFIMLDARSFRPTRTGFEALEAGTNLLKTVELINKKLKTVRQIPIVEGRDAMNGLYLLNNDYYLSYGQINASQEYRFLNCKNEEIINWGDYPNWAETEENIPYKRFVTYLKNSVVCPQGDKFASFYVRFKKWRIYSNDGKLLYDIDVDIEPNLSNTQIEFSQQMFYYMGQPVAIGDFIYVLCGNNKEGESNSDKTELQVWDWQGNPIACYSLGGRISSFAISEKYKKIYAFNNIIDNEIYICNLSKLR